MATKITREILESYLQCNMKGQLKLAGEQGSKCEYELMLMERRAEVRQDAVSKIAACHNDCEVLKQVPLTISAMRSGPAFILDATLEDNRASFVFDGLKRVEGASALGGFHYVPIVFFEGEKISASQRMILDVYGLLISHMQERSPSFGVIWHGDGRKETRVKLSPANKKASELLRGLESLNSSREVIKLHLNEHCQVCEFRNRCHERAVKEDNLSLLRGLSVNEAERQNLKGIFTVNQLSYTFRIRRQNKRVKRPATPHHFALKALAIREGKIFVHGRPELPVTSPRVFVDIEGDPERMSYYLIGAIAAVDGVEIQQSFWANDAEEESAVFCRLLDFLGSLPEYSLLHFGSYEATALQRMKSHLPKPYHSQVDAALERSFNVLSAIRPFVYFPTYSNGLKDLASYLGHTWSEPTASGIQSIVWRRQWLKSHQESLKRRLTEYNLEDCLALRKVVGVIDVIIANGQRQNRSDDDSRVVFTDTLPKSDDRKHVFKKANFVLSDLSRINNCAYFDYQRDRVYARSNAAIRSASKLKQKVKKRCVRPNKEVDVSVTRCEVCNSRKIQKGHRRRRLIIDLKFFHSGVKRWVVQYMCWTYRCKKCGRDFIPRSFPDRTTKYGHGLVTWCIYQNMACGQNMLQVQRGLFEVFGLRISPPQFHRFKTSVAQFYQARYEEILKEILSGKVLNIDETEVDLRGKKGYVWVVTSLDAVYYFFKESREGAFLKELLRDFKGVLVSDFYTAYDSLDMPQQRCLIHLIRDLNEDLLKNPFNEEFRELTSRFSALLRSIVDTIDRFGLKKRHLGKHQPNVRKWFDYLEASFFSTEVSQKYQKRLQKYRNLLFAFLDHDDVPWNNNNAEHAIKVFARYRRFADGRFTDQSIRDYLTILSVYQTCEYRGVDFLKFLLAEERERGLNFGPGTRKVQKLGSSQNQNDLTDPTPNPPSSSPPATES